MTESDKILIKRLWESGETIEVIIRMLPYNVKESRDIIAELRSSGYLSKRKIISISQNRVADAYNKGNTDINALSQMFGYTPFTIEAYLRRAGIHRMRPPHNSKTMELCDQTLAIIADLKRGSMSQTEIAKTYGVSRQYVHQLKNKNNL